MYVFIFKGRKLIYYFLKKQLFRKNIFSGNSLTKSLAEIVIKKSDTKPYNYGFSKITDIDWSSLAAKNPKSLDDNQGAGIKCRSYATWMRAEDNSSPLY